MTKDQEGLTGHEMLEVDARYWWQTSRATILSSPGTDEQKQARIEALGPAPAAGTTVLLDRAGKVVNRSGLEAVPTATIAPTAEPELVNETGQQEIPQGVLGDDEGVQLHDAVAFWNEQRKMILDAEVDPRTKQAALDALGPEPAKGTRLLLVPDRDDDMGLGR